MTKSKGTDTGTNPKTVRDLIMICLI